ncbi:hypothetical protein [Virgibacillus necropolis]|uniref:Uncharacterized protein n=1 Tax=Virgibacillus necropolis TaxID=163877 RepID=A0A221MCH0_9BACI|nr:hypothetical protein [Virgibacillus necropolis]ASN05300.1 hypothetical protein CFK40_09890 [Virgibacillus necropolis]
MMNAIQTKSFEWINGESVLDAYKRLDEDARQHLHEDNPKWVEWLYEAADSEVAIVREYLYLSVQPGQLPDCFEEMITDADYTPDQLANMRKELSHRCTQPLR